MSSKRHDIVENMRLTAEECWVLSEGTPDDRLRAARSANCPPELLLQFANEDGNYFYHSRIAALHNRAFPLDELEEYALSGKEYYYEALSGKHLTEDFLGRVAQHSVELWQKASNTPRLWHLNTDYPHAIYWILKHPKCPTDLLNKYSLSEEEELRFAVASNSKISWFAIDVLSRDSSLDVRLKLVANKAVSTVWLADMAITEEHPKVLVKLVSLLEGADREGLLKKMSKLKQMRVHRAIAVYSTDPVVVGRLCYSPSRMVRSFAAGNPVVREEDLIAATLMGLSSIGAISRTKSR